MSTRGEEAWTIDELGEAVSAALSVGYEGQENGQVRDVPDRRTIRYYTTLGLIDRPAAMRGRTALYGRRHLLQLVAIKRLQARGLSLAEVQGELTGLGLAGLKRIAALPEQLAPEKLASATEETGRRDEAFWGSLPPDETETEIDEDDTCAGGQRSLAEHAAAIAAPRSTMRSAVELAPDVLLVFANSRDVEGEDLLALQRAAEPLLGALMKLGLVKPGRKEER